ncbi:MAG: serine hydrolase [Hyphomicrobiaceae bacterium]
MANLSGICRMQVLVLAVLTVLWAPTGAVAGAEHAAMVIDANTGKVLHSEAADEPRYPASLTKMMTLYLAFELIERGRLSYSDKLRISAQAATQPPSKLELEVGDEITVRDAVSALVTKSANDIAVALAEKIAGSEANFARLMSRKAAELGMSRTVFRNASGLPNSEQVTTARDMLTLALRLHDDFPVHYRVFATQRFAYRGKSYRTHNTLLVHYRGTEGIKTGYTRASGFNLVASVKRDGRHLVAAVFGGRTAGKRNSEMRRILDKSFAKASTRKTRRPAPALVASPRPAPKPARVSRAPTAPPPVPQQAPEAVPAAQPPPGPSIEIARVRTIGIAEQLAGGDSAIATQNQGAVVPAATEATPPGPAPVSERPAGFRPDADTTSGAAPAGGSTGYVPGRPPSTLHEQLSRLLAAHNPEGTMPQAPTPAMRGSVSDTPPAASPSSRRERRSGAEPRPSKGGGYMIQVGAYATAAEAARQLDLARAQAQGRLSDARALTEPVQTGDGRLYRARFAGLGSGEATETCLALRRQAIDCFVARAP